MNVLSNELREVITRRVASAGAREILAIASALCGDDTAAVEVEQIVRHDVAGRFQIVDDQIVIDHSTGLTWLRGFVPGGRRSYDESMAAASGLALRGWKWRAPTIQERIAITDYGRHNPAIDTNVFHSDPSGWEWTSTVDSESPQGCAWVVNFSFGYSYRSSRSNVGFVRAVRVGQF